ncbi:MAG: TlpA family protein disulfide reductase [Haliscomenobacter sp.]|nr:TlpA family protein disulfide reductase [Haliscomenobacter sp.]
MKQKIQPDSTLLGGFRSGTHYQCAWEAKRNPTFQLRDPHELTGMKTGFSELSFRFKNASGEEITLENPRYAKKVKVVQIMGTWCPNCRDETEFLVNYLRNNPNPNLEIIGLAFEQHKEEDKIWHALENYKNQMMVPYEILHAGGARHDDASKALPMLTEVTAFPTLILIDPKNRVRKIHTGFAGPATSGYQEFKKDFESSVQQLLNEKNVQ